ncbi:alpha/beta hydrolase-fold protein [Corynebacterium breve]|uniref:Alpha/beta hydrolase-fold protein n=1 Tax=Corynebacterium breve TaxID=3049799 RepID=A0ABY8VGS2_9CORY|nr:alpha/beta hydrolase-fold protein [Corynebacterium breve]WIM68714.1 alpha/beta hydrolase-fold protein [Corynebacterium breve]
MELNPRRGLSLALASALSLSVLVAPDALAQSSASGQPLGQSDASSAGVEASSLSSASLMEGPLGDLAFGTHVFGGSSGSSQALGSSTVDIADTFPDPNAPAAEFVSLVHERDNLWTLTVYSPSMQREITNDLVLPEGGPDNTTPRPTYYLLGGAGGGGWTGAGGAPDFFKDKLINVVTPRGAVGSQQADWAHEDPEMGIYKWSTYLAKELPQLIDEMFYGNGTDGIGGMSMSGGPALHIATMDDRFKVAGTYSSCQSTTGVLGQPFASSTVRFYGGDPANMWGASSDPAWAEHSPMLNLEDMRGIKLFAAASRGVPTETDEEVKDSPMPALVVDEQFAYACSRAFVDNARDAGLDIDWYEFDEGTHNWGLFRRQLPETWKTIGPALGVE